MTATVIQLNDNYGLLTSLFEEYVIFPQIDLKAKEKHKEKEYDLTPLVAFLFVISIIL